MLNAQTVNKAVVAWLLITTSFTYQYDNREMVTSLKNIVNKDGTSLKKNVNKNQTSLKNTINEHAIRPIWESSAKLQVLCAEHKTLL